MAKQPDPLISFFQRGMAAQKAADDAIAAAMPKKPAADDPSRPIVCRVEALALREILADDKLQPIFGGKKLDMFQMTKAVNKHLK